MAALVIFEVCEFAVEGQCLQTQYQVCVFLKEGGWFAANLMRLMFMLKCVAVLLSLQYFIPEVQGLKKKNKTEKEVNCREVELSHCSGWWQHKS